MSSCAIELVVAQLSVVEIVLRHMWRIPATRSVTATRRCRTCAMRAGNCDIFSITSHEAARSLDHRPNAIGGARHHTVDRDPVDIRRAVGAGVGGGEVDLAVMAVGQSVDLLGTAEFVRIRPFFPLQKSPKVCGETAKCLK
jgi:hypothetical protein